MTTDDLERAGFRRYEFSLIAKGKKYTWEKYIEDEVGTLFVVIIEMDKNTESPRWDATVGFRRKGKSMEDLFSREVLIKTPDASWLDLGTFIEQSKAAWRAMDGDYLSLHSQEVDDDR